MRDVRAVLWRRDRARGSVAATRALGLWMAVSQSPLLRVEKAREIVRVRMRIIAR